MLWMLKSGRGAAPLGTFGQVAVASVETWVTRATLRSHHLGASLWCCCCCHSVVAVLTVVLVAVVRRCACVYLHICALELCSLWLRMWCVYRGAYLCTGVVFTVAAHVVCVEVQDVTWSPCGTRLASASLDKTILVWDVTEAGLGPAVSSNGAMVQRPVKELLGHDASVQGVAWDPAGKVRCQLLG